MSTLGPYTPNTIVVGDCLQIMADMPDGCVDLVITDAPYGIEYETKRGAGTGKRICATFIEGDTVEDVLPAVAEICRVLKDSGALYWFTRLDMYCLWYQEISKYLTLKTPLIWDKKNDTMGDLQGDYGCRTEPIIFAVRGRHLLRGYRSHNLISFTRPPNSGMYRLHPHQKPVELMEFLIKKSSDEGDIVFDPFIGSGTTAVAAAKTGRLFFGCDVVKEYVELARHRVATEGAGQQLAMQL